ncbi:MAG TPA: hypothetical protein VFN56_05160 [Candidatus Saccharimonadales bacterium]|nr:hypothetical protein [Candidatus Saccharimonadales bacterium]
MDTSENQQDPYREAVAYIRTHQSAGVSIDVIRQHFLQYGWSEDHIDQAIAQANAPTPAPAPVQAQPSPAPAPEHQQPEKYRVFAAIRDTVSAISHHWQRYFSLLLIGMTAYVGGFILVGLLSLPAITRGSGAISIIVLIIAGIALLAWQALTSCFLLAATSHVLAEADVSTIPSLKQAIAQAAKQAPRTALAYGLANLITFLPLVLTVFYIAYTVFANPLSIAHNGFSPLVQFGIVILDLIWVIVTSLRFILVQQVAVFEPQVPIKHTLSRSYALLRHGGQWFVVKLMLLVFVIVIIVAIATSTTLQQIQGGGGSVFSTIIFGLINFGLQGVLTLLYLNRVAVRTEP